MILPHNLLILMMVLIFTLLRKK